MSTCVEAWLVGCGVRATLVWPRARGVWVVVCALFCVRVVAVRLSLASVCGASRVSRLREAGWWVGDVEASAFAEELFGL